MKRSGCKSSMIGMLFFVILIYAFFQTAKAAVIVEKDSLSFLQVTSAYDSLLFIWTA